ncbi:hypothetical protein DFJ74DRAFT_697289 [Hyaloraphidium curvatum]|nr:hypothetical protein DFJ74DRAFT_697289 [Hyaloraphidium curvatum]
MPWSRRRRQQRELEIRPPRLLGAGTGAVEANEPRSAPFLLLTVAPLLVHNEARSAPAGDDVGVPRVLLALPSGVEDGYLGLGGEVRGEAQHRGQRPGRGPRPRLRNRHPQRRVAVARVAGKGVVQLLVAVVHVDDEPAGRLSARAGVEPPHEAALLAGTAVTLHRCADGQ